MARPRQRHWAQWVWLMAALALALRIGYIFWGEEPPPEAPEAGRREPAVTVVSGHGSSGGALVGEQVELFDQQPLSMPTRWNAGSRALPGELQRQPGQVFGLFEPRLIFAAEKLPPVFAPRDGAPANATAGLRFIGPMAGGWAGVGRFDRSVTVFPGRDAAIEVVPLAGEGGGTRLTESVQGLPSTVTSHDWGPLEYSVAVAPSGLVGMPTLGIGSGFEVVDSFFGEFLVADFRLGDRLLPGLYRVRVSR